jgi:hypothetical protein
MTYECPACKRSFAEPGFCPFDGKQLASAAADQRTMLSEVVKAQVGAETLIANNGQLDEKLPPDDKHTKPEIALS